jgi:hypothetical protein
MLVKQAIVRLRSAYEPHGAMCVLHCQPDLRGAVSRARRGGQALTVWQPGGPTRGMDM